MKLEIKRIVRPLRLREYAEEYGDEAVWVWVNPPRSFRMKLYELAEEFRTAIDRLDELVKQGAEADAENDAADDAGPPSVEVEAELLGADIEHVTGELHAWWAEMWSQGADEATHWTADEVGDFIEAARDSDPKLWDFAQEGSLELQSDHRTGVREKKS